MDGRLKRLGAQLISLPDTRALKHVNDDENRARRQPVGCGYVTYLGADSHARQGLVQGGC
jgi:hypothetical protein